MQLIATTRRGRFAEFTFVGDVDFHGTFNAFRAVHAHCTKNDIRGALVDFTRTRGGLTPLERIEIARMIAPEWSRDIILAVVVHPAQHLDERPGQLAAQNRGLRAREFTSHTAASDWLIAVLRDALESCSQ